MTNMRIPHLNQVSLIGNLTAEPRIAETQNGIQVANFHIAINKRFKTRMGDYREDVCFVGVVAWDGLAVSCEKYLEKGSTILVNGELQSRTFSTDDGSRRTVVEIKAHNIEFLKTKKLFEDEEEMETEKESFSFGGQVETSLDNEHISKEETE